jgi:hypothetical protein
MMGQENKWSVTLVSWDDYLALMLEGTEGPRFQVLLSEMDLIIGGLSYDGDFMYVVQTMSFQHFLTIILQEILKAHMCWTGIK